MIKFQLAVLCALLILVESILFAQDIPTESRKGKEHRTGKAGVNNSAMMGDGSVRFDRKAGGTQSSGAGAGKITKTSSNLEAGRTHSIKGGWDQNKSSNLDAGAYKGTGEKRGEVEKQTPRGSELIGDRYRPEPMRGDRRGECSQKIGDAGCNRSQCPHLQDILGTCPDITRQPRFFYSSSR